MGTPSSSFIFRRPLSLEILLIRKRFVANSPIREPLIAMASSPHADLKHSKVQGKTRFTASMRFV